METKENIEGFTPYQKFIIAVLAILQFTVILDFMVLSPLGDILMKSLTLSPSEFGFVVSSYAFSAGGAGILAAGFADKYDRKKLLLFFYGGFVLGTLMCALANSYITLLAARIITGIFGGVIFSVSMAIVTDIFSLKQRGRVMGFIQMSFAASQILGIPIGLYLANIWDWHAPFLMIVGFAIIIGVLIIIKMKPVDQHLAVQTNKSPLLHLFHTLSKKEYQNGLLATTFLSIGGFMLMPFGSAFLVNNVGILQEQLPLVFMFTGISAVIIMPVIGKLSDKIDKFKLFTIGSVLSVIMVLIYTNLSITPLWMVIAVNMIMFMGIMSRMIPSGALTSAIPELKDRGAFMSIMSSLQQIAGGIASVFAGFIVTQKTQNSPLENYSVLGIIVSMVILICIYFMYVVARQVKSQPEVIIPAPVVEVS